jgi:KipI family sensor histidine kinase inhibitor
VVDVTLALPDDFAEKIMQQLTVDAQLVKRDASPATDEGQPASRSEGYAGALLTIPVWYHSDVAPDLQALADGAGLSVKQVISLHTQTSYTVCALGFAPGFPYLGFVDARLAKPRLATPRHRVAAGSIGIADNQTGIYPSASPGGWNIIGRTPLKCFDVNRPVARASLFAVGQTVRFESVSREQYEALRSDAGLYLSATCADKKRQ